MEYAQSYALYNWKKVDPSKEITEHNVVIHRNFSGLIDENFFIVVHVAMVSHTGKIVSNTEKALLAA